MKKTWEGFKLSYFRRNRNNRKHLDVSDGKARNFCLALPAPPQQVNPISRGCCSIHVRRLSNRPTFPPACSPFPSCVRVGFFVLTQTRSAQTTTFIQRRVGSLSLYFPCCCSIQRCPNRKSIFTNLLGEHVSIRPVYTAPTLVLFRIFSCVSLYSLLIPLYPFPAISL